MAYPEGAFSRFHNYLDEESIDFQSHTATSQEFWERIGEEIYEGDEFMGYCIFRENDNEYPYEACPINYNRNNETWEPRLCRSLKNVCATLMAMYGHFGGAEDHLV